MIHPIVLGSVVWIASVFQPSREEVSLTPLFPVNSTVHEDGYYDGRAWYLKCPNCKAVWDASRPNCPKCGTPGELIVN